LCRGGARGAFHCGPDSTLFAGVFFANRIPLNKARPFAHYVAEGERESERGRERGEHRSWFFDDHRQQRLQVNVALELQQHSSGPPSTAGQLRIRVPLVGLSSASYRLPPCLACFPIYTMYTCRMTTLFVEKIISACCGCTQS